MNAHTKGPWRHFENSASTPDVPCIEVCVGSYTQVAYLQAFPNHDLPADECRANARLVAAAPELLEACRELLAEYGALHAQHNLGECDGSLMARAAIAKATGAE